MLKGKRILVTSGGTQEYIDDVRVMTNISTGKLGAMIAEVLWSADAYVTYLHGKNAVMPPFKGNYAIETRTAQDAYNRMEDLVPTMDAVVHCMAVSDFTFKRTGAVKLKSSDPQAFIDYMRDTITFNPKIITKVKEWNPKTFLVGFKFEVGIPHEELIALAQHSIEHNGCNLVIANDKVEMTEAKDHVAYFVMKDEPPYVVKSKSFIARELAGVLNEELV